MNKKTLGWLDDVLNFVSAVLDRLVEHSDAKIEEVKRKALHYIFVYGVFTIALLFVLVGVTKYLSEIFVFASEGIGFIIVGSIMIVLLATYTMFSRL